MKKFTCNECTNDFTKNELDPEFFEDNTYICKSCANWLAQVAWDAVDPDHNFESFSDWDERGH